MSKSVSFHEQKSRIESQIQTLKEKLELHESKRVSVIGELAKKYGLLEFSDEQLEKGFQSLNKTQKSNLTNPSSPANPASPLKKSVNASSGSPTA